MLQQITASSQVEPEEEVDLLVDDVLREDAEAVVPLRPARRAHRRHVAADRLREGRAQRAHVHLLRSGRVEISGGMVC